MIFSLHRTSIFLTLIVDFLVNMYKLEIWGIFEWYEDKNEQWMK